MIVYDERGHQLELVGAGHRGGEGTVHRIAGDGSRVAKIYHAGRLGAGLHAKLRVMLAHPPDEPSHKHGAHRSIVWVDGLLFADRSARDLRGFTMPYVDTDEFRQAHVYYDAADRLRVFGGGFTWRHLLFAARNLSSAVEAVHAAGHRVGDLRETNLLVAPSALVTLIDCDSFQIRDPRTGEVHPTRVATGDYLPPELQGIDFRTQHPDRYQGDLFALAVLVFRFLMLGVHPFQARGPAVAEVPTTEAKIRRGWFAFGGRHRGAQPPEYAPPYAVVPKGLQDLFAQAFVRGHADPDARPSAAGWAAALDAEGRRLRTCGANTNHLYAARLRACPWCRLSPDPFPVGAAHGQIPLEGAPQQIVEAARVQQVRAYARVALADGAITDPELAYLRKAGGELGLRVVVVDRAIDDEARRVAPLGNGHGVGPPPSIPFTPQTGRRRVLRDGLAHPVRTTRGMWSRQRRSAVKAVAPVLVLCASGGALGPVVVPVGAAVIALPLLALAGEIGSCRTWRARATAPLRFVMYVHVAVGHAARVFVPLSLAGLAASFVPGIAIDTIARAGGAIATTLLAWLAITRLVSTRDRSSTALRAGRDLVWRGLVGDSGRARRATYALWAACAGAGIALGANHAVWWPLPIP